MSLTLSVLDQSPVAAGQDRAQALRDSVRLARAADTLGYHRYWVAEHHGSATFAGSAPVVLAATLLANTTRLRVGTGGVLLPRHDPLDVAASFAALSALHPGRVDLGVGRAGGPAHTFPARLRTLRAALPGDDPELWLLGSSGASAELAAAVGASYCFGHFLNPSVVPELPPGVRPALAVRVAVAPTLAEAESQAADYLLWRSRKDLGANEPLPAPGTAAGHAWTPDERIRSARNRPAVLVGTPSSVRDQLAALADRYAATELVINTLAPGLDDRIRTYELLAATVSV